MMEPMAPSSSRTPSRAARALGRLRAAVGAEARARRRERAEDRKRRRRERKEASSFTIGGLDISVRLLGVALLVALLGIMFVPSLHQLWLQEAQYREITAKVQTARDRNADIREQLDLWNDPTYVASQARERLGYVKPGETQYSVADAKPAEPTKDAQSQNRGPARPWMEVFAALLAEADHPTPTK